jgi:protein-S-isoprenylcysteine O-methyltransferase Ste14
MTAKTRFVTTAFVSSFCFSMVLFVSAGRIDYMQGWVYFVASLVTTSMDVLTVRKDAELMRERSRPGEGTKPWDKLLLGISALVFISTIVVAGLDSGRYRWSPRFPWIVCALGILLLFTGQIVFLVARHENKFFSTVVRIQKDRGHTVCDTGIYRVIRHPGYLGMIVSTVGVPLILGSLWSLIPTVLAVILLCIRTFLEDMTLRDELPGYLEYTRRARYRLIPWIW